jgi:hypothetical protein
MKILTLIGVLVLFAVSMLVCAFIEAATFHKLWAWFVAHEYGTGPTYGAWYGLSMIFTLAVGIATRNLTVASTKEAPIIQVTVNAVTVLLSCGIVLLVAYGVGSAFHWVH